MTASNNKESKKKTQQRDEGKFVDLKDAELGKVVVRYIFLKSLLELLQNLNHLRSVSLQRRAGILKLILLWLHLGQPPINHPPPINHLLEGPGGAATRGKNCMLRARIKSYQKCKKNAPEKFFKNYPQTFSKVFPDFS